MPAHDEHAVSIPDLYQRVVRDQHQVLADGNAPGDINLHARLHREVGGHDLYLPAHYLCPHASHRLGFGNRGNANDRAVGVLARKRVGCYLHFLAQGQCGDIFLVHLSGDPDTLEAREGVDRRSRSGGLALLEVLSCYHAGERAANDCVVQLGLSRSQDSLCTLHLRTCDRRFLLSDLDKVGGRQSFRKSSLCCGDLSACGSDRVRAGSRLQ